MNAMKNKIKSQRGASITFALLLFLVCAVVSSVVIVAATAAAGRMSEQADMDERYYAVTAVAARLNQVFDGKEVVVEYDLSADEEPDLASVKVKYSDGTTTGIPTILQKASADVVQVILLEEAITAPAPIQYTDATSKVQCTVKREMQDDGRLVYTISAQTDVGGNDESGIYKVFVSISPNLPATMTKTSAGKCQAVVKWKMLGARKNRAKQTVPEGD